MENNKSLKNDSYLPRLIDKDIEKYLTLFGAISIEGPKWCGKTWTGKAHAKSLSFLDYKNERERAMLDPYLFLQEKRPQLVDEWTRVPELWDTARMICDEDGNKGKFILTCSTELPKEELKENVFHSGAGRIAKVNMNTMSLYESGASDGKASLLSMFNEEQGNAKTKEITLEKLAHYIIRGGWPGNINTPKEDAYILPEKYIEDILEKDISDNRKRNKGRMKRILLSLARNEATFSSIKKILNDCEESTGNQNEIVQNRKTVEEYLDVLYRLHILNDLPSYSENCRSSVRVGLKAKRYFTDPSLTSSLLGITNEKKMVEDLETFGILFESLAIHDLRIYTESLGGKIYQFHENSTGKKADAILEFRDGEYAAAEIKLGFSRHKEAMKNLNEFSKVMTKKPKFMLVVVGLGNEVIKVKDSNTYIAPLTSLKP